MAITQDGGSGSSAVPAGVRIELLKTNADDRGSLTELFRQQWYEGDKPPIQWNCVKSKSNVLRGVHVHHIHEDYLFVAEGRMLLALYDIRRSSTTFRQGTIIEVKGENPNIVSIPVGVAHGFYFPESALVFYGVTDYWDLKDELECRWDDPGLKLPWQITNPVLSTRDEEAGSLADMIESFEAASSGSCD